MKCVYCPIDTRLNFHQVSKLLKEVQVRRASQLCLNVGTWHILFVRQSDSASVLSPCSPSMWCVRSSTPSPR